MVSFDDVERALRRHTFGTLSTLTEQGTPHATGVVYAVSAPDEPLILYVTTRTSTRKVRNIRSHPEVAFVIPVPRRFVPAFPPRAIQFQGTAGGSGPITRTRPAPFRRRGFSAGSLQRSNA